MFAQQLQATNTLILIWFGLDFWGIEIRCQLIQSVLIVKVNRVNNVNLIALMYFASLLFFFKVHFQVNHDWSE